MNREEYIELVMSGVVYHSNIDSYDVGCRASDERYQEQLATYQARVRDLEELSKWLWGMVENATDQEVVDYEKVLYSTTTPDTALQRKVLVARIDEVSALNKRLTSYDVIPRATQEMTRRGNELRAQLASINKT